TSPGAGAASGATTSQGAGAASTANGSQAASGAARFEPTSVPGWAMMTPQEQQNYSDRMNSVTTVAQCRSFHDAYMAQMQTRARNMGQTLESQASDPCVMMQKQGTLQR
ncbi:MAG: hypothetical protein ACJ8HI_03865, partial [Massilia sp.]